MKEYIAERLNAGKKYNEILEEVKREMVSQMLVRTHGNQTEAARLFDANRGTMRNGLKEKRNESHKRQVVFS